MLRDNLTLWTSDLVEGADGGNLQDDHWNENEKRMIYVLLVVDIRLNNFGSNIKHFTMSDNKIVNEF